MGNPGWDEVLAEFRSLGGVADNVRLGYGSRGRGLFVIDPAKPATVHVPENMLVPTEDFEIRDDRLAIKSQSKLGDPERRFFERYDKHCGSQAGLLDETWRQQTQWSELPVDVRQFIMTMGAIEEPERRFATPSLELCLHDFVRSRDILYREKPHFAPLIDLLNHSSAASDYVIGEGIAAEGIYEDEVLVKYNDVDSWALMLHYGFADACVRAYSLGGITVDLYARHTLSISREVVRREVHAGFVFPVAEASGNAIGLSHLTLGNFNGLALPRAIFRNVMGGVLDAPRADEVFESIVYYNRGRFHALLRLLNKYDGPLIGTLRDAALHQLEALSACVGAQPL
ncbi:MAG TPA: hypothetical protein VNG31_05780 [Candidatus Baltobacteraceae bacterium]|nr:hypothetical protein [Candidatus Baltobacteraceae bacterium]